MAAVPRRGGDLGGILVTGSFPFLSLKARLYRINLLTGQATLRGVFKSAQVVVDIAVPLDD